MCKCHSFYVQFVFYDLLIEFWKLKRCLHIHLSNRLTVLDVCSISAGTSHHYQLQDFIHVRLQFLIDIGIICNREVTQVNTFWRILINASYQILVDIFRHERNHRSCSLADFYKCCVQSHVGIDLILLHTLCPETLTASSYIPVTHIIYKILQCSCCFRDSVIAKIIVYFFDQSIQLGQ